MKRLTLAAWVMLLAACQPGPSIPTPERPPNEPTRQAPLQASPIPAATKESSPDHAPTQEHLASDLTPATGKGQPPPNASGLGPWATRLMLASSRDGLVFTRSNLVLSDQAGVPNMVTDSQGRPRIYYVDFGNGNIIAMAMRAEDGEWGFHRVHIAGIPSKPDPVDPTVVLLPDGRLRLYYMQGVPTPSIYSAISDDGISFTVESGSRLALAEPVFDPMILQTEVAWLMWAGPDGQFTALSADGLSFEIGSAFLVNGQQFMTWAGLALPTGGYRLYGNFIGPGSSGGLTSLRSPDGTNWFDEGGTRLSNEGADPNLEAGILPDCGVALLPDGSFLLAYLAIIP